MFLPGFSPLSFPINIKYNFKIKKYFDSKIYIFLELKELDRIFIWHFFFSLKENFTTGSLATQLSGKKLVK